MKTPATREAAAAALLERCSDARLAEPGVKNYLTVRLASPKDLLAAARLLKGELGFGYLEMITAVDWLGPMKLEGLVSSRNPNPFTDKLPGPPVPPAAGAGAPYRPVLDLLWSFGNLRDGVKVFLRLEVPRDHPEVPSLAGEFAAADWQEREVYDLLGVRFAGHPNLTKILTPDFINGHPLRKDYAHEKDSYDGD
ncbi:MAG: NADH-quinone oxidoreductase subunit C [Elusimicrobia bacterium]|nr:NADH-quinone oxidoreductase subunit C [Elusimicrobiota bacterium]